MTKQTLSILGILAFALASGDALLGQQTPASGSQTPAASAATKPSTATKPAATGQASTAAKSATGAKKPATSATAPLTTQKQKGSYAIGLRIGGGLQKDGVDLDSTSLSRGIRDGLAGNKPLLTDQEAQAALTVMATEVRAKQQAKLEAMSAANKKVGDAFLAENKTKEGVVALPSGLQYKILKEGTGPKPTVQDSVVCDYRGTLIDGKEFDSSYKRGKPLTIPVSGVIKGWTEAMQLMPVGSKWQLFLPADLAYGNEAMGPDIQPGSALVFEVELHSIAPKAEAPKTDAPKTDAPKVDPPKADAPKPTSPK